MKFKSTSFRQTIQLTIIFWLNVKWKKNDIDCGFAKTYPDKMAGNFKRSKDTEFINVLLNITRWLLLKWRNDIKYDATDAIQKWKTMLKEKLKSLSIIQS